MTTGQDSVLIGFLAPEGVDDLLRLQVLLQGTSKSTLLRDIVVKYIEENSWDIDGMMSRYAEHLFSQWNLRFRDTMEFRQYIIQQESNLKGREKLPERLFIPIIQQCEELHKKHLSKTK